LSSSGDTDEGSPDVEAQPRRWTIGDVRVTKVLETVIPTPPSGLLPTSDAAVLARHESWLAPHFVDDAGNLLVSVHALVVESRGRRIVVDTCVGNNKLRPFPGWSDLTTDFLERLTAAGFPPESIDTVVCTHLHFDHVGWNTRLIDGRWVPTFPNARYLFGATEWGHWRDATGDHALPGTVSLADSVQPVVDAGLVDLVASDHRVTAEVQLEPTPGHTPGHHSVLVASGGVHAVITGDLAHHPVQFAEPDWASAGDADPSQAAGTRRAFLERHGDSATLVIGTHFAGPTAGHAARDGDGWRLIDDA
jgi:glyoxylase-like metal-dependent hydrolase (beta-lactamase superfamily II)